MNWLAEWLMDTFAQSFLRGCHQLAATYTFRDHPVKYTTLEGNLLIKWDTLIFLENIWITEAFPMILGLMDAFPQRCLWGYHQVAATYTLCDHPAKYTKDEGKLISYLDLLCSLTEATIFCIV